MGPRPDPGAAAGSARPPRTDLWSHRPVPEFQARSRAVWHFPPGVVFSAVPSNQVEVLIKQLSSACYRVAT